MKKFSFFALLMGAALVFGQGNIQGASMHSDDDLKNQIQRILRDNPGIILDVLRDNSEAVLDIAQQGSNLRRQHNLQSQWREDMKNKKTARIADRPVLGNPNAKVKIIAFSDFTCHFCEQASKNIKKLLNDYGQDVSYSFKHLPLDEKGPGGIASEYFIAISMQDKQKAWDFHDAMFANRARVLAEGEPFIKKTAQDLKVDMKKLERDRQGKKLKEILNQDTEDAQKLGVEGTPYFLVNDLVVRGAVPIDLFRNAVDMALKGAN